MVVCERDNTSEELIEFLIDDAPRLLFDLMTSAWWDRKALNSNSVQQEAHRTTAGNFTCCLRD